MPKVSIIVVNYKGKEHILNCLRAIEKQRFKDFEIVIVDNGSSDDSLYEIQSFLGESLIAPLVRLIPLAGNSGFAGGNLEGLRYANGEYIALLNNDTEADVTWLGELVKAMDHDTYVGICASKLLFFGADIIDSAGDGFSTFLKGFKRGEGENASLYDKMEHVFGACAGAALYRKKMLDETGFFDEDFFLVHEDTDLNFRAQLAGWKAIYVPSAVVYHKVGSSIGHMSDTAVYYTLRNSEFVRIKNVPFWVFIRFLPEFIIVMITEFIYFAIKHRKFRLYFKAKMDALKMLPRMLKKRKAIFKTKRVGSRELMQIMTPAFEKSFFKNKLRKLLRG